MKKAPFITYVGATLAGVGTLVFTNKIINKYGQPLKAKKKFNPEKLAKPIEKGLDFITKKK